MKIIIKNLQKRILLTAQAKQAIKKAVRESCKVRRRLRKAASGGCVTVCVVDDKAIKELNLYYLAHNETTDVITFDLSSPGKVCADIAVSADTAALNARLYGTTPLDELLLYCAHGMLHMFGYKDETLTQRRLMNQKALGILKQAFPKSIWQFVEPTHLS